MNQIKGGILMKRQVALILSLWTTACLVGCATVTVYQSPISKFQAAVNSANASIQPYLVEVNSLIIKANLYDKIGTGQDWGTEDLKAGIPEKEIQVRLLALSTIASYADALGKVANSKDVESLGQAAKSLGDDVKSLSDTFGNLVKEGRATPGKSDAAKQAARLDLSSPLSSLVTLFGTLVIEAKQKEAIEKAIVDGAKPIETLIDLLKADLRALTLVNISSYDSVLTGMVGIYNSTRKKAAPKDLIALVDEFVKENHQIQTLRAVQMDSLLTDMKSAHTALVAFAKSSKKPKDLADLAAQIDVFTAHVKLVEDAISSVQASAKSSK